MVRIRIVPAAAALLASHIGCGAQVVVSAGSTAELVADCARMRTPTEANFCSGYILGIFDQMSLVGSICPPLSGSSSAQAIAVARKFLSDRPDLWHKHPSALVGESLSKSFPCR